MSINVQCAKCSKQFEAPEKLAGQRVMCPGCGAGVRIPAAGGQAERKAPQKEPATETPAEELGDLEIPFSAESGPPKAAPSGRGPEAATDFPQRKQQSRGSKGRGKSGSKFELSGRTVALLIGLAVVVMGGVAAVVVTTGPGGSGKGGKRAAHAANVGPTQPAAPVSAPSPESPPVAAGPSMPGPTTPVSPEAGPAVLETQPQPRPTGDPYSNRGQDGYVTPGQAPGYSQYGNPPGGPTQLQQQPTRPQDIADWKRDDYFSARAEGDARLVEAVGHLGQRFVGRADAARMLAQLLAPPKPAQPGGQGPQPGYSPQYSQANPQLVQAIVAALGVNGTDVALGFLEQLLSGTLATDDDKTAVDAALKVLADHPSAKSDDILFRAVTAAEKLRAPSTGQVTPDELRQKALEVVSLGASDALRTKLARYVTQPTTPPEWRDQIGGFLVQQHPDNVGAQLVLYQGGQTSAEMKVTLEQYFTAYSSATMGQVLGIPDQQQTGPGQQPTMNPTSSSWQQSPQSGGAFGPGGPPVLRRPSQYDGPVGPGGSPLPQQPAQYGGPVRPGGFPGSAGQPSPSFVGPGPGWPGGPGTQQAPRPPDPEAPYRRARQLWSPQSVAIVEGRLAQVQSLGSQAQLVMLAGTFPVDSVRRAVWNTLHDHWTEGPQQLDAGGLATTLITDPGLLLTIKTLPRRFEAGPESSQATPGGSYGPSTAPPPGGFQQPGDSYRSDDNPYRFGRRAQLPDGSSATAPVQTAREAIEKRVQAERDWMKTCESLVRAWCERLDAAATAGNQPGGGGANLNLPIKLHPQATVVAEYHLNWPDDLGSKLSGVAPGPMQVHYLRITDRADPITRRGFYQRQLQLRRSDIYKTETGYWMDRLLHVPKTEEKGPIDKTGWKRSVDVLITLPQDNSAAPGQASPQPPQGQETDLVIQILSIEMKDPAKS
jgi:hypothetical protein